MNHDSVQRREVRKIRYRPGEWQQIVARARDCRMPPARYVREISLGPMPRARRNRIEDQLIVQLGRIGNNLNQLARVAHAANEIRVHDELRSVLEELILAIRKLG